MAGIMERVFGTKKPQGEETMQVRQPAADPAAMVKQPPGQSANGEPEPLPLDNFKDVWQTPTTAPDADPFATPLIAVDPAKIQEAVGKMDFLSGMPGDLLTKATSGDAAAFGQVINTVIQKAMAAQVQLAGQMTEGAISKNNERYNTALPKRIREAQVKEVRSSNPVLNHPAAAPMLDTLKRQFMSRHPDKSPQEIHAMAEDMLSTFASELTTTGKQQKQSPSHDPQDFSSW